jgi:hypothetical protein
MLLPFIEEPRSLVVDSVNILALKEFAMDSSSN